MRRGLYIALAVLGLLLSLWSTLVYPRVCVCSFPRLNLWCFDCKHFASACPRYWPRNEFGQKVRPFCPSCLLSRYTPNKTIISR